MTKFFGYTHRRSLCALFDWNKFSVGFGWRKETTGVWQTDLILPFLTITITW